MNEYKYRLEAKLFYSTTASHKITINREWDYFRFSWVSSPSETANVVGFNRTLQTKATIETVSQLDFAVDDYVLIRNEKYKINTITRIENERPSYSGAFNITRIEVMK